MNRVEIKNRAKEFAYSNKWPIWRGVLLLAAINFAVSFVIGFVCGLAGIDTESSVYNLLNTLVSLALMPMTVGLSSYLIKTVKGEKDIVITDELFSRYKDGSMFKIILVSFVAALIIGLGTVLLIVPGIIASLGFAMMSFILAESSLEDMDKEPAYKTSWNMMKGHKWEYFVFLLSFLGWFILCGLTLGILYVWILPYFTTANIMWYQELKKISK